MSKTRLGKAIELIEQLEDAIESLTYKEIYDDALELLYKELRCSEGGEIRMLNPTIKIKDIFDSFKVANEILKKSYKQYDDTIKQDVIYDFKNEFFQELEVYLADRDDSTDLLEDYARYEFKMDNLTE